MNSNNEQSNTLEWLQFIAKYAVIIVSAFWVLYAGTDLVDKQTKSLELKNLRLSKSSIPLVSHNMTIIANGPLWGPENDLCMVTGNYTIKNTGELPVLVGELELAVYEFPPVQPSNIPDSGVYSYSLQLFVERTEPMHREKFMGMERVSVGGSYQRSYGYAIRKRPDHLYAVVGRAKGGLSNEKGQLDTGNVFGESELLHITQTTDICP